ncbi:3-oxoacyl-ACP reductase FabG [Plantactinospora sp. B6F1]|uniref:3-oxoacyl-ACP reductase FabG n=1 Tax=Plantactinospora sp. B6F1 TaxID=3158971 RepID=UPI0032D96F57
MAWPDAGPQRVAIVTGAARGIGAATAARLAADGLAVAVLDLDAAGCAHVVADITARGGRALPAPADVTDPVQVRAVVAAVAERLGPPTVVVNNAGVIRDGPLAEMTDGDWDVVHAVNLRAAYLMCREVRPYLVAGTGGRIVALSSVAAVLGNRDQANYAAAKAGVLGLVRGLAQELGPFGVTVNAVGPGYIATEMTRATAGRLGVDFAELQRMVAAQTPVRRVGRPEDVAHAVAFLVSPDAGYITGEVLHVNGGVFR